MIGSMMKVVTLPGALIGPRDGGRRVDNEKVKAIAASIKDVGLLSPIIVTPGKLIRSGQEVDGWEVLAGQHRFKALSTILFWQEIPCLVYEADDILAHLIMIDENLMRQELSTAERAEHTARRKVLYEALHPETKSTANGGAGRHAQTRRQNGEELPGRFTKATAEATGQSERAVQRDAQRGEELADVIPRIKGTSLDAPGEMDALMKMKGEEREAVVSRAAAGERVSAKAPRVEQTSGDKQVAQTVECEVARIKRVFDAASAPARREFLRREAAV